MNKEQYLSFIEDVKKTIQWIADNIEDEENALTLITWINKMSIKLKENLEKLEELKEKIENEEEN